MNIQIVSQHYYPDSFRINDIAEALAARGHTVRVLTGLPDYTLSKVPPEYKLFRRRRESLNGVEIRRVPTCERRKGAFFRALNYASFAVSGALYALLWGKNDCDVIYVNQTSPVLQAIPAIVYKWRSQKKLVLCCADLWPESIKAWNINEESLLFRITRIISGWLYRSCDLITITSEPFRQYLTDVCGVDNDKIVYQPQHAQDLFSDIAGVYEDSKCVNFLFAGNLGSVQNVDVILQATAMVEAELEYCVHIVGDGTELNNLKALARELGVDGRVVFHGCHPQESMVGFYSMAHCFLLTLRGGDFIGMTLPAKAQGYLCAGKPVLAAIDGAGSELIKQAECGEAVPAGDARGLAEKMALIIRNMEDYKAKGLNGRRYYEEHFTADIFICRLLKILS